MTTHSQVLAALDAVDLADTTTSLAAVPGLLLPALVRAVGADAGTWTELDAATGRPLRYASVPASLVDPATAVGFERYAADFPLARHTRPGGDGGPMRRSDLQGRRSYHDSPMYTEVLRPLGAEEIVALSLPVAGRHVCVSLVRSGRDFDRSAVDLLAHLRPLLIRRLAELPAPADPPPGGLLTERQREVLRLVAGGLTDAAIAHRLGCSRRTVTKHLENTYRILGVQCRAAAIANWLAATSGAAR